jgi:hypothetical protein
MNANKQESCSKFRVYILPLLRCCVVLLPSLSGHCTLLLSGKGLISVSSIVSYLLCPVSLTFTTCYTPISIFDVSSNQSGT